MLDRIKVLSVLVSWKYHLKRHLLIHSDKRPFICDLCNKGFNDKTSLRAHCRRVKPCSTESKYWAYWWVESIILNNTCLSIVTRGPLYVTFVIKGSMIKLLWGRTVEGWRHARQNQNTESTGEFFKIPSLAYTLVNVYVDLLVFTRIAGTS